MSSSGLLITLEGGEGAGKSTLLASIYEEFKRRGVPVLRTFAPGGTDIGTEIRKLLLHTEKGSLDARCELFLYLADRAQHADRVLLPALKRGEIILCDRFHDSTVAYQGVARGFSLAFVRELCLFASQGLQPDLTLYLDIDPELGFKRVQGAGKVKDRMESETLSFHQKIREAFKQMAKEEPKRFVLLDATLPQKDLLFLATQRIDALLTTRR